MSDTERADRPPLHNFRGFNFRLPPPPPPTHTPLRPTWACACCEKDWPCDPAREALAVEYQGDRVSLAMRMWSHLEDYALDQGPGPLGEAWVRFIGWSRSLR